MRALLVTFNKYPNGDAGAVRVHMLAKILAEAGYETVVISMGKSTKKKVVVENDGIKHMSYRGQSDNNAMKAIYYIKFPIELNRYLQKNAIDLIVHTQIDVYSLRIIQKYGITKKIPVLYDSVEWYSESQFAKGVKASGYQINNRYNMEYIQSPEAVIAISSYLEKHFVARKIRTIRIPAILDTESTCVKKIRVGNCVNILYAGSPGKKDYLSNIISGLSILDEQERNRIVFTLAGCTESQLKQICGVKEDVLEHVRDSLRILGRISRERVIEEYKSADFSVLVRPDDERYAQAGFPTKFVESMSCSTPVICNITSDLGEYVKDGINSIVLKCIEPDCIAQELRRVISFDEAKKDKMKNEARKTAVEALDYRQYKAPLMEFIQSIR